MTNVNNKNNNSGENSYNSNSHDSHIDNSSNSKHEYELFNSTTQAIIYGYKINPIQRMLDFDYMCRRTIPSIAAIIQPTQMEEITFHKAFWGTKEIILPVYSNLKSATKKHQKADVMIDFSSFRSAFNNSKDALECETIRTIVIIAEGIPERQTRTLISIANTKNKFIIGPATVGGVVAGAFKIGSTGGTYDNIKKTKLYRPGSVGFVSKSGGMSNEMYYSISQNTDGIYEGFAIGGDKFPGTSLISHLLRYEANSKIKLLVALGEVGGMDEYQIVDALQQGKFTKPLVMWVSGTSSKVLPQEFQFGHAGACAVDDRETADAKNHALRAAGAIVPQSYEYFDQAIRETFEKLRREGKISPIDEIEPPIIPMDFNKAVKEGLVRRSADVIVTISDDRGDVPQYFGVGLDQIIKENRSIGYVIGLLWFKRKLPEYAQQFIEMIIKLTADHGPAVSGAHNAIVTARAGKDLMSSLASGILTVGPRFGGAISDAALYFKDALEKGMSPEKFIDYMKMVVRKKIPGIGHRIKSITNPDVRVELLKNFVFTNFAQHKYLDYALEVEKITTAKRSNLILNVDGCIGICFIDLLDNLEFSDDEKKGILHSETLNGLFVLGRSIGIMGHVFDQKRQHSKLYREPWDEILYTHF